VKLKVRLVDLRPELIIQYERWEWEALEKKWQELGFEKVTSRNLYGEGIEGEFYRETNQQFARFLMETWQQSSELYDYRNRIVSDINSPVVTNDWRINVGILRIVPNERLEVVAPLSKLLTLKDLAEVRDIITAAFVAVVSTVTNAEVEVKFILRKTDGGEV